MAIPSKPGYSQGSTGTQPGSPIDYANGDALDPNHLDYYVNTPFEKIKALIDNWHAYDSNDDGVVDAADTATNVKGNDIDSNGDGTVDEADSALAYKGNDIDSDGDGVVDAADQVNTGGTAAKIRDTTNGQDLLVANENGPVNVPVALQEQTNRVATRNWATGGNIAVADLADALPWSHDGGNTVSGSGGGTETYNLSGTYDAVKVIVQGTNGGGSNVDLRVNGDSGTNYETIDSSGSTSSGDSAVEGILSFFNDDMAVLWMMGRWSSELVGGAVPMSGTPRTFSWENESVTSPLNQFTFITNNDINISYDVYGIDVDGGGLP